jgi:hypothetical protein
MARVCVLHVGTEKTGSTSIQRFLGLNREALRRAGAYVPASLAPDAGDGMFNHIGLTVVSRPDLLELDDLDRRAGLRSVEDKAAFAASAAEAFAEELAGLDAGTTVLMSNEHIHSRLGTAERLRRLRAFLGAFSEVRVIVYLRSQYEMARSLTNTALRQGRVVRSLLPDFSDGRAFDPELPVDRTYFDLHALVERLEAAFGRDALRVRLFPEGRPAEDLIRDYCEACGVDLAGLSFPPRENASFSSSASLLFRDVNAALASLAPAAPAITTQLSEYLSEHWPGRGLAASAPEAERFMEAFASGNELLRRSWFPHEPALFEPRGGRDGTDWRPLPTEEAVGMLVGFIGWRDRNAQ